MIERMPSELSPGRERADWIIEQRSCEVDPDELKQGLQELAKDDPETFCTLLADALYSD